MPMPRLLIALTLTLAAALLPALSQASDNSSEPRPKQWAQSINNQYNLYRMSPTLYRSALPDPEAQTLLDPLKVETVVNFLKEPDSLWLSRANITQVQLPFRTKHVDDADVLASLRAILAAEQRGPVLMHCKHGLDRTGLMAAMYRVVVQGWSKEQALDEMRNGGFGDSKRLKYGTAYLQKVDVDKLRNGLASGACSTSPLALCAVKEWFGSVGTESVTGPAL